jgi:hypothetical protein
MTETFMRAIIAREVERIGSMRSAAKEWGVSVSYVCDVLQGRRAPGPAILGPLGYERLVVTTYRRIAK